MSTEAAIILLTIGVMINLGLTVNLIIRMHDVEKKDPNKLD